MAVSPVSDRAANHKPFTSAAGGLESKFEYRTDSGWGYTASEERANLAACPATNVIAQAERERIALGRVCADLLNDGRLSRAELPKFYGALIRSVRNPYRAPAPTGDLDTQLVALARAGCATQIAAVLPGNRYNPKMWAYNTHPFGVFKPLQAGNTSGLTLPHAWRGFAPCASTLLEAVEAAPPCSTPADGTLLGSVHNRPGADPELDCLGAWAAQTVRAQKQFFMYGLGKTRQNTETRACLQRLPLSIISRSPESPSGHPAKRGRIPCGVVETLLFMPPAEEGTEPDSLEYARVQVAAARRTELAAHLAVGGLRPAHHSVVDALLDDPRNDWCETESEFRRKIVTAAISQTAGRECLDSRADRLIAEHVVGDQSEEVTETELRCLRTVLMRRCEELLCRERLSMDGEYSSYHNDASGGVRRLSGGPALAADSEFPLPEIAARVTGRLGDYARAVNRMRRRSQEGVSAGRLFLQTLLTLPGLPLRKQAEMYAFERVVCAGYYEQTAAG